LGYDVDPRGPRLVVNAKEAVRVRAIFALYLERGSLERVVEELGRRGWVNKRWQIRQGRLRGGRPFTRTSLHQLLTNVSYRGQVRHKAEVHAGEHEAIVEPELWQRVQELLCQNGRTGGAPVRNRFGALLKGLLHCVPCGCPMTPTHTTRNGTTRYRYYACLNSRRGSRSGCPSPSLPAPAVERCVVEQIRAVVQDPAALASPTGPEPLPESARRRLRSLFGPAWEALPSSEQVRILGLIVERVEHDGVQGKLAIRFSAAGLQTLASEAAQSKGRIP
jgi:site-specific DNA recombinase